MCECVLPVCVLRMCVRVSENVFMLLVQSVIYVHIIALFSVFVTYFNHIAYYINIYILSS